MLRFNKDRAEIHQTLMHLSVEECLPDAEIAARLGVSLVTAGSWRRRLGIPVSAKFFHHFDANYGAGAVQAFRDLLASGATYADIGKHFGFSRQRAQQITQEHFRTEREESHA